MKNLSKSLFVFFGVMTIVSCTKTETTPPTAGETNSILLAGAKGSSVSWKIASITQSYSGGSQTVTPSGSGGIPACEADNVYQFSYSSSQSYAQTEGTSTCTNGDPNTVESGSWAFTDDGKTLLIGATVNATSTQLQSSAEPFLGYMILGYAGPLTVVQLTSSSLSLSYTYTDNSGASPVIYTITLAFTKA